MLRVTDARARDGDELRERLRQAHLMLVFTPEICTEHDPLVALDACLRAIDVVQVRPKAPGTDVTEARATWEWTLRVLDLVAGRPGCAPLVLVNDRVDVAAALLQRGCDGVHVGQDDAPPGLAREVLGDRPLLGLSTHDMRQVAEAQDGPADYLGFGPFAATATKGYDRGLGGERCWIASAASDLPVFAIGGIGPDNVRELQGDRRAAVGSAILNAADPQRAADELRAGLLDADA